MQQQQDYYDPALEGLAKDMQIVLKIVPFKPLYNRKTGNFFSYSYSTATRNQSANADDDIEWINFTNENIPKDIRDKARKLKGLHEDMVILHAKLRKAAHFKNLERVEELEEEIKEFYTVIDDAIYPESERKYIESKEAERFRLDQQGELKLDAASIAALTAGANQPPGATADASIAQAKLEVAEKDAQAMRERMAEMQAVIDAQAQAQPEEVPAAPAPKPRKKAAAKKAPDNQPLNGA